MEYVLQAANSWPISFPHASTPGLFTGDGDRRASPPERRQMGMCLGAACMTKFCSGRLGKSASRGSSTKDFIEAVRLDVFTPPGSPFDRHSVVVFPLSMNNPGLAGIQGRTRTGPRLKHSGLTMLGSRISSPQLHFRRSITTSDGSKLYIATGGLIEFV
jgi:hypothetical protein